MTSTNNYLPRNATSTNRRHAVIEKLKTVIDMMERASSIENITGYDHPDESFAKHIQRLEDKTFYYLKMCYCNLEHFILKNTRHHEETIRQKMIINPSFLAPTTITNHPYTPSTFVPMEVFCKDYITQTAFIPAVLEICLEHHFYPYSECGGLLTSFSVYGRPKRDTNVLIEVMNLNNTRLTSRLFSTYFINGYLLQQSNSLGHFYHPGNRKAFDVIRHRDDSILFRSISGVHPVQNLLNKLNELDYMNTKAEFIPWFGFVYHYIHIAAHQYPSESGFMFHLIDNKRPVILAFLQKERDHLGSDIRGRRAIHRIFDSLDNPTGLFHKILLYRSPCLMNIQRYIQNKGDYYDSSSPPKSLLECFVNRKRFHTDVEIIDELDILYWIFRTWPESIERNKKKQS